MQQSTMKNEGAKFKQKIFPSKSVLDNNRYYVLL